MMVSYQQCSECVMDTSDPNIYFDKNGVCKHCIEAKAMFSKFTFTAEQERKNLSSIAQLIKEKSANKKYHAIIGLSGGVDSSYVTHLAKEMNLNPLVVHFDNGWNSERSVSNIKKIIDKCGFDLETYVIDWKEFKDLQRSFFKAGVVDIEILSDHAIMASLFRLRSRYNIKYILSGSNFRTEHGMPLSWLWRKQDYSNIKAIHKQFGTVALKSFPRLTSFQFQIIQSFGLGGTLLEPLNHINYNMSTAIQELQEIYDWEYYGGKHYESVFTKFYQNYVLPVKFGYDKRRPHLSALIRNKEITRSQALTELESSPYKPEELVQEKEYVLKKLGFTEKEFDEYLREKPKSHLDYPSDQWMFDVWNKYTPKYARNMIKLFKKKAN